MTRYCILCDIQEQVSNNFLNSNIIWQISCRLGTMSYVNYGKVCVVTSLRESYIKGGCDNMFQQDGFFKAFNLFWSNQFKTLYGKGSLNYLPIPDSGCEIFYCIFKAFLLVWLLWNATVCSQCKINWKTRQKCDIEGSPRNICQCHIWTPQQPNYLASVLQYSTFWIIFGVIKTLGRF